MKAGWRNGSIKYFVKKMSEGSKDTGAVSKYSSTGKTDFTLKNDSML